MKAEVRYEVVEVKRYEINRRYNIEGYSGVDFGHNLGEYKTRSDAERVCEALEADVGRRIRSTL